MKISLLLLELAFLLICAGCGGTGGTGPRETVRKHALEVARGASLTFKMDVSVTDLSESIDGNTAVVTGTMVARYKNAPSTAGKGPFNPYDSGFGATGTGTKRNFRATCRKFDSGWKVEEFRY
jgi:hypothetical protein